MRRKSSSAAASDIVKVLNELEAPEKAAAPTGYFRANNVSAAGSLMCSVLSFFPTTPNSLVASRTVSTIVSEDVAAKDRIAALV